MTRVIVIRDKESIKPDELRRQRAEAQGQRPVYGGHWKGTSGLGSRNLR